MKLTSDDKRTMPRFGIAGKLGIIDSTDDDFSSAPADEEIFWSSAPPTGEGKTNNFLPKAAHFYRRMGLTADDAITRIIERRGDSPHRCSEIEQAVQSAFGWTPDDKTRTPRWPPFDEKFRNEHITGLGGLDELRKNSSYDFDGTDNYCDWILAQFYKPDDLLCIGFDQRRFDTRTREEWRGKLSKRGLIVPSPMTARTGLTQDGKVSAHTLNNTGPRAYIVVEQDKGTIDQQAAVLLYLGTFAPLALVVHSGGKSLHGYFPCAGQSEEKLRRFFSLAVRLGADPVHWCRSQFARLPDGIRADNGARQRIEFFREGILT